METLKSFTITSATHNGVENWQSEAMNTLEATLVSNSRTEFDQTGDRNIVI